MKIRYKNGIHKERRDILKAITHAGISSSLFRASPLVGGLMAARVAEAQSGPNKSITTFVPGGSIGGSSSNPKNQWLPTGSSGNLNMRAGTTDYNSIKNDVIFFSNGRLINSAGHGSLQKIFNADAFGRFSLDVDLGMVLSKNLYLEFFNVGPKGSEEVTRGTWDERKSSSFGERGVPTIHSPTTAFNRLLAGIGTSGGPAAAADPRVHIVDLHNQAMQALKSKLGAHEKVKVDQHLTAISELESQLETGSSGGGATCDKISMPGTPGGDRFEKDAVRLMDIVVLALQCDLTRSASMMFGDDDHDYNIQVVSNFMHKSHHANFGDYPKTCRYMHGLNARLIRKVKDAGLLDKTIVTQVSDMGDADKHTNGNIPMCVAGGGISGGKIVNMSGKTQSELFQTVSEKLGVAGQDGAKKWANSTISGV